MESILSERLSDAITAWIGLISEDEENKKPGPPYTVKLIDFAHTRLAPGAGPDKGVLLGLDNILKLIDGRIKDIKASP